MAQIHCYVPDAVAEVFRQRAAQAHLSVSKYLARLVKREVQNEWPEGYFENFGTWEGEQLHRPDQGRFEDREPLD